MGKRRRAPSTWPPRHWLTAAEQARFLRAVDREAVTRLGAPHDKLRRLRDAALARLLLQTGLTVSELRALRQTDLCPRSHGRWGLRAGRPPRLIPLPPAARRALAAFLRARPISADAFIFAGPRGRPISTGTIRRTLHRLAAAACLAGVTPQVLRVTYAKALLDRDVRPERVGAWLGEADRPAHLSQPMPCPLQPFANRLALFCLAAYWAQAPARSGSEAP